MEGARKEYVWWRWAVMHACGGAVQTLLSIARIIGLAPQIMREEKLGWHFVLSGRRSQLSCTDCSFHDFGLSHTYIFVRTGHGNLGLVEEISYSHGRTISSLWLWESSTPWPCGRAGRTTLCSSIPMMHVLLYCLSCTCCLNSKGT